MFLQNHRTRICVGTLGGHAVQPSPLVSQGLDQSSFEELIGWRFSQEKPVLQMSPFMALIFGFVQAVQGKIKMFCRQILFYLGLKVLGIKTQVRSGLVPAETNTVSQ